VAAFLLYNYSTTAISAVRASSFSNIITVVTVLAGVIILKEKFTILEYILCAVIILGVWGVNTFTAERNRK
jgi:drug/metabolite transporter (DMT)-like permease